MTSSIWLRDLVAYALQALVLVSAGALLAGLFRFRASTATLIYWQALLGLCLVLPVCQRWRPDNPSPVTLRRAETAAVIASPAAVMGRQVAATSSLNRWTSRLNAGWPIQRLALLLIAGGILVRALWLAAGFLGLARLRRRSRPAPDALASVLDDAQRQAGVRAEFRTCDRAAAPITFGLRRPLILLPANIAALEPETQRAIVCHELLHVRRRDWPWCVAEELVRAVLWFHPAVWWLIGRIHLTREQVVDDAVIGLTATREQYVEALLAVAQSQIDARLVPAPLFLRKSLLKKRVAEILKEKTMTARRLILCLVLSAAALLAVIRTSTSLFPLRVHAQELSSAPIQILQGGDNLTHRAALVYPERALEKQIAGDVALDVSIDEQGQVSDARVVSGPEELRRECLQSVLEWRFRTPSPGSTEVVIHFQLPDNSSAGLGNNLKAKGGEIILPAFPPEQDMRVFVMARPTDDAPLRELKSLEERMQSPDVSDEDKAKYAKQVADLKAQLASSPDTRVVDAVKLEARAEELRAAMVVPDNTPEQAADMKKELAEPDAELKKARDMESVDDTRIGDTVIVEDKRISGRLIAIQSERVPQAALDALTQRLGVHLGDMINDEIAKRVSETVHQQLGEQFRAVFHPVENGGVELVIVGPQ